MMVVRRVALLLAATLLAACGGPLVEEPDAGEPLADADAGSVEEIDAGPVEPPPLVCTSGTRWTRGDRGSSVMRPGHACIDCHQGEFGAPRFKVAGTVFPTVREPDDCNGLNGGIDGTVVQVTSATGTKKTLSVNSAGNFYLQTALTFPLTVKVIRNGKERAMQAQVTNGDCNSCHTQEGLNDAPGRIHPPDP